MVKKFSLVHKIYSAPKVTTNESLIDYAFTNFINSHSFNTLYIYYLQDNVEHKFALCDYIDPEISSFSDIYDNEMYDEDSEINYVMSHYNFDDDELKTSLIDLANNELTTFYIKCVSNNMNFTIGINLKNADDPFTITMTSKRNSNNKKFNKRFKDIEQALELKLKSVFKVAYKNVK